MKIYMAGGVSGNLKPFWKCVAAMLNQGIEYREAFDEAMQIYLADVESRHWIQKGLYADIPCEYTKNGKRNGLQVTQKNLRGKPAYTDKIQLEGLQCNCSLRGSLHGGVGGVRPNYPRA